MYNDNDWASKKHENSSHISDSAKKFLMGHWIFLDPGDENEWSRTLDQPNGAWNCKTEKTMLNLAGSGLLVFRGTSPFVQRIIEQSRREKTSTHFNAELSSVHAANHLRIYRAAAYWCSNQYSQATKLLAEDIPEEPGTWEQLAQGDLARERDEKVANLQETAKLATV